MEFGIQFFPDVGPEEKSGEQYFDECLRLTELCDEYGYTHVRTVEHYFTHYGGYSPNPHLFLTAASQRTRKARLITGAVLPIFNHPLKIAGEIGMLDSISGGRLECGFGRAFLPHEFARFERSPNDSRARFDEGVEQVMRLLSEEHVTCEGKFHSFKDVTSLPRPVQRPLPPCWTAAVATPATLISAAQRGHGIMLIPMAGHVTRGLIETYNDAWKEAGHPGRGRIMLAHHMFCHEDADEAVRIARDPLNHYLRSLVAAASDWMGGASSDDYPGYDKIIAELDKENFDTQVAKGVGWIGTPERIIEMIESYVDLVGGFDLASLQVNFNTISYDDAAASMRLFGEKVIPHFSAERSAAAE
jgi:alkanesulfonate monooxygenase SsuD/methylene tetrahydromethanopterin reductase-like flavin-dependent oxidoreductase (luciferase family)